MLGSFRNKRAGVLIWALLVALIIGLAGFGIGVGGGVGGRDVARVGDQEITSDAYVRALQQELRALNQQIGRDLPMAEARQFGVDRMVLARLVNDAALDEEAARLGVSTGDETVRAQVMATPAFQGASGSFDRLVYTDALDRAGLRPDQFESLLRGEATRSLLASGVQAAATLPDTAALTVLDFLGEKRAFDWIRLDASLLPAPIRTPTEAELQAEHDAHAADRYTRPETRQITTASITPETLAAGIEIPEDELRAAYEANAASFQTPERRALDRIAFPTEADATAAKARLDQGAIDFDALAAERGLKPEDIDQGILAADALPASARDAVFGLADPGIAGPVDTPLGPALYRVNAIMAAKTTPFEEAKTDLLKGRQLEAAKKQIAEDTPHIEDLIAGGATLEEIASETVMQLGSVALNSETKGGLADDPKFRDAAAKAAVGEETDLTELAGGGLVTLRVDKIDPPAVIPLAEIRDRVAADWTRAQTVEALTRLATDDIAELKAGLAFADLAARLGVPVAKAGPLTRGEQTPNAPAGLVAAVFGAEPGAAVIEPDGDGVVLAQLTEVQPFDPRAPENTDVLARVRDQFRSQVRDDVLALYTAALRDAAGVTINQAQIDATLARFP